MENQPRTNGSPKNTSTERTFSPETAQKTISPLPRKNSQQDDDTRPPVSPKPQRLSVQGAGPKIDTPPRPRQSQINRAWGSGNDNKSHKPLLTAHEEQDEKEKQSRGFSPSRIFGRRSSPSPRSSPVTISPRLSPRASPQVERREHSLSPPSNDGKMNRSESEPHHKTSPSSPPNKNPFTQAMVDSMLKYILASDDPTLKAALREAVLGDPQLVEELKKK